MPKVRIKARDGKTLEIPFTGAPPSEAHIEAVVADYERGHSRARVVRNPGDAVDPLGEPDWKHPPRRTLFDQAADALAPVAARHDAARARNAQAIARTRRDIATAPTPGQAARGSLAADLLGTGDHRGVFGKVAHGAVEGVKQAYGAAADLSEGIGRHVVANIGGTSVLHKEAPGAEMRRSNAAFARAKAKAIPMVQGLPGGTLTDVATAAGYRFGGQPGMASDVLRSIPVNYGREYRDNPVQFVFNTAGAVLPFAPKVIRAGGAAAGAARAVTGVGRTVRDMDLTPRVPDMQGPGLHPPGPLGVRPAASSLLPLLPPRVGAKAARPSPLRPAPVPKKAAPARPAVPAHLATAEAEARARMAAKAKPAPAPAPVTPPTEPVTAPVEAAPPPDSPAFKVGDRIQPQGKQQFAGTVTGFDGETYTVENPGRKGLGAKFNIHKDAAEPSTERPQDRPAAPPSVEPLPPGPAARVEAERHVTEGKARRVLADPAADTVTITDTAVTKRPARTSKTAGDVNGTKNVAGRSKPDERPAAAVQPGRVGEGAGEYRYPARSGAGIGVADEWDDSGLPAEQWQWSEEQPTPPLKPSADNPHRPHYNNVSSPALRPGDRLTYAPSEDSAQFVKDRFASNRVDAAANQYLKWAHIPDALLKDSAALDNALAQAVPDKDVRAVVRRKIDETRELYDDPAIRDGGKPTAVERLDKVASDAAARIKTRNAGRLNSGLDPADLADYAVIGAAKIAKGAVTFARWSADMAGEFGDAVRPHLQTIWEGAQKVHGAAHSDPAADLHATARGHFAPPQVKSPTATPEPSPAPTAAIPAETPASQAAPAETAKPALGADELPKNEFGMTMAHVKEAADNLGIGLPDKSEFSRSWADVKAAALADADAVNAHTDGKVSLNPALTMEQAYVGHLRLRQLTEDKIPALLEEAQKSPGGEVQGRLDAAMQEAADLAGTLYKGGSEAGRRLAFQKALVTDDLSTATVLQRAQAATGGKLSKEGAQTLTNLSQRAQRIKATVDKRLDDEANAGIPANPRTGKAAPARVFTDEAYQAARERLKKSTQQLNSGIDPAVLKDAAIVGGYHFETGLRRFADWATRMRQEIPALTDTHLADLWKNVKESPAATAGAQKRADATLDALSAGLPDVPQIPKRSLIAAGTREYAEGARDLARFGKRLKAKFGDNIPDDVIQRTFSQAAQRYRSDYKGLIDAKRQMADTIGREAYNNKPWLAKAGHTAAQVIQGGRSVVTSFDVSAPGRQGYILLSANPAVTGRALAPMFKSYAREEVAQMVDAQIKSDVNYARAEESGLSLSSLEQGDDLRRAEEAYRGANLAEKIPVLGKGVRASERAYVTFLNKARMDNWTSLVKQIERRGTPASEAELKAISNYINVATGRGNLGKVGNAATELLNNVYFAPRFTASRFQYLAGQPLYQGTKATRALIARQYVQTAATTASVLGLAKLMGAEVNMDPRSSDFLKIKVGNTRFDVLAGMQQAMVFTARMATGQRTVGGDKVQDLTGEGMTPSRADIAVQFNRGKLAPIPSSVFDVADGKNMIGEPVTPASVAVRNLVPMNYQDLLDAAKSEGVGMAAVILAANTLGIGANAQEPRASHGMKGSLSSGMGGSLTGSLK